MSHLHSKRSSAEQPKPTIGETSSVVPTSVALAQLMPSPNVPAPEIHEFASPTPMIAPIRVWELDAGKPRYHVPRFQIIAENSRAKTIANPAPEPTLSTNSTGRSANTPKATAPSDTRTPIKFQQPDQITATQ